MKANMAAPTKKGCLEVSVVHYRMRNPAGVTSRTRAERTIRAMPIAAGKAPAIDAIDLSQPVAESLAERVCAQLGKTRRKIATARLSGQFFEVSTPYGCPPSISAELSKRSSI